MLIKVETLPFIASLKQEKQETKGKTIVQEEINVIYMMTYIENPKESTDKLE